MKKVIFCAVIAFAPLTAMAAGGHGPAGCGLGTEVMFQNANEWHEHVMAATTNASSSNQTFGMTSGTLGCEDANGPLKDGVALFIDNNIEQLASDSAKGHGETLVALSEIIGIEENDRDIFNSQLKTNFDKLFSSEATTSGDVYNALAEVMAQDAVLSKYLA